MRSLLLPGFTVFCLLVAGGALAAPQSSDQQKCITKLNKAAVKLAATQGKAIVKCVDFYGKAKLDKLDAADAASLPATRCQGQDR